MAAQFEAVQENAQLESLKLVLECQEKGIPIPESYQLEQRAILEIMQSDNREEKRKRNGSQGFSQGFSLSQHQIQKQAAR